MGHITFLDIVRLAHVLPILHVQANNRLLRRPHIMIFIRPNRWPRLPPILLHVFRAPCLNTRLALLEQKAEVENIFNSLGETVGVEETIHSIDLGILVHKRLLPLLDHLFIVNLLRQLRFIFIGTFHSRLTLHFHPLPQCLLNDANMFFDRAQFVPVALLLLSSLIHIVRLFLLFVLAFFLCLLFAAFGHFAFLGGVFCIEGSIEEGHVTG
mmetsp:Transcript_1591/g.3035  ORF Transcript_1591/g.3035 Transcript_1591/m.3035 type:complete len:211 (-) Transcript_1591:827-1459(-)